MRVLPIRFDEGGERWRTIPEAYAASQEAPFDDWPLDGVRSTSFVLKQLRRHNRNFVSSHSEWVRNSGIRATDRAVHEHGVLSKALELGACYDQVQLPNLAMAEVLVKRRMLIEAACKGRPEAPKFEGAEHIMGYREEETGEVIDPEVIKYQAAKMKDETAVMKEQRLKKEEAEAARRERGASGHAAPAAK